MSDSAHSHDSEVFHAQLVGEERPPRRRTSVAGMVMIVLVVSILVIPLIYVWIPQETARWHLAAAHQQRLDGDLGGAVARLDRALDRIPSPELYLQRAQWHRELGNYELALGDVNQVLEELPDSGEAYLVRSRVLQHLGRFQEAVDDLQRRRELAHPPQDLTGPLNDLAYARALANQDLDQALGEVEEALAAEGGNPAMLDTRGFIHYMLGNLDEALADLDDAVRGIEDQHQRLAQGRGQGLARVVDQRQFELVLEEHKLHVAVLRYHRSLIRDSLGQAELAEEDRQRVLELGFEPGDHLF